MLDQSTNLPNKSARISDSKLLSPPLNFIFELHSLRAIDSDELHARRELLDAHEEAQRQAHGTRFSRFEQSASFYAFN